MDHTERAVNGEASGKCRCYVIQTLSTQETRLISLMDTMIGHPLYSDLFIPKREMNRKFGGRWRIVTEPIFPGYVFVMTPDPESLFLRLRNVPKMSRLLHGDEYFFIPLTEAEENFIGRIGQRRGDHTIRISEVAFESEAPYKKGDHVKIISGDLKDFEGELVAFNFRKRKAIIKTKMFAGNDVEIHVGLEIVQKTEGQ